MKRLHREIRWELEDCLFYAIDQNYRSYRVNQMVAMRGINQMIFWGTYQTGYGQVSIYREEEGYGFGVLLVTNKSGETKAYSILLQENDRLMDLLWVDANPNNVFLRGWGDFNRWAGMVGMEA